MEIQAAFVHTLDQNPQTRSRVLMGVPKAESDLFHQFADFAPFFFVQRAELLKQSRIELNP